MEAASRASSRAFGPRSERRIDLVRSKDLDRAVAKGRRVRRLEDHRRRMSGASCFFPARCAEAPSVSLPQAGKSVLRPGCRQIVPTASREREERLRHRCADDMHATVSLVRPTVTIAERTRERGGRAERQFRAVDASGTLERCGAGGPDSEAGRCLGTRGALGRPRLGGAAADHRDEEECVSHLLSYCAGQPRCP